MAQSAMTVRLDSDIKTQFDALCNEFGMSANTAINIFVNAVVNTRSIPFTISAPKGDTRRKAMEAFMKLRQDAESRTEEMTLEEINNEIKAVRAGK